MTDTARTRPAGLIEVERLHIELGHGPARFEALQDLHLSIEPGEFVCLLGPSGCGKSTLLGALAGHLVPSRGELRLDGRRIAGPHPERGLVFQQHTLFPWQRVIDNVAFGLKMQGRPRVERQARARALLHDVGLAGFEGHYPRQLSGGMQQRVEMARVLIHQPRVLLMDEPFGALDALTRRKMQQLLLELWQRMRMTVVFVTHDIDEALLLADRLLVMSPRPGRLVEDIALPFGRPRDAALMAHADVHALKRHCLALLEAGAVPGGGTSRPRLTPLGLPLEPAATALRYAL